MKYSLIESPSRPNPPPTEQHACIRVVGEIFPSLLHDDPQTEKHLAIEQGTWILLEHLLFKKLVDRRHRLPCKRDAAQALEPLAELLITIRELCKEAHAHHSPESYRYVNATVWFICIVREIKLDIFRDITTPIPDKKGYTKDLLISQIQGATDLLRKGENPYDPQEMPHSYALTEVCLDLLASSPNFRKQYWLPFLGAFTRWRQAVKSPEWQLVTRSSSGKVAVSNGKGRGKRTLP